MGYVVDGKGYTDDELVRLALNDLMRRARETLSRRAKTSALRTLAERYAVEYQGLLEYNLDHLVAELYPVESPDSVVREARLKGALKIDRRATCVTEEELNGLHIAKPAKRGSEAVAKHTS